MIDDFEAEFADIIESHAESIHDEDSLYGERRDKVRKSYRKERFYDDTESMFDDYE